MWDQYGAQGGAYGGSDAQKTTLWMGDLEPWMDENYIRQLWMSMGENVNVKMIRDKYSGGNAGYCFVDFASNGAAMKHLTTVNGTMIPGTTRFFKLNWASGGGGGVMDMGPEYSIFVGDLGPEVTDFMLLQTFQTRYVTCKSAKVVTDPATGMSRGYGFVRFADEAEQQRALAEMQGQYCGSRAMRISMATPKNNPPRMGGAVAGPSGGMGMQQPSYYQSQPPVQQYNQFNDPTNTTVFVGGLNGITSDEELRSYFLPFGDIVYTKIPPGKGCGFVQFVHRQSAEMAIAQMNGFMIGGSRVRLSWGRSQAISKGDYRPSPAAPYGAPASAVPASPYGQQMPQYGMQAPQQPPAPVATEDPLAPVSVEQMNEDYIRSKEQMMERSEAGGVSGSGNGDGWRQGVYA